MASSAVHPVPFDDDDDDEGAGENAPSAPSAPVGDVLASSSSRRWPSVSDSDSDATTEDPTGAGAPITYPKIYDPSIHDPSIHDPSVHDPSVRDPSDAGRDGGLRKPDDEGEVLELVEEGHGSSEGSGCFEPFGAAEVVLLEEEILEDSVEGEKLLYEVESVLSKEEAQMLRSDLERSAVEEESSLGSVVDGNPDDEYTTRELPGDWLGVEDASSSVVQETHGFQYTPVKPANLGSKRVYTFPRTDDEVLPPAAEVGSQILAWPVGTAIEIVGFQVRLIAQMFSLSLWLCSFSFAALTFPFRASLKATSVALTTVIEGYTLATQIKPMVKEGVAQAGPILRRTTKKCGFGCLAAVYVMFMLGSLLVPALFLDLFLVRGMIEEPVEIRERLHFDYRQERPSAIVHLLPLNVLAKVKDNVYPDKVLRARAIPPSHKLQVTIFLNLPESRYNLELGMFQVSAELLSVRGQVLKRASWPCMLRFQSSPIRYAKQVILGVPLLMGISKESQVLSLRLFENEEPTRIPTAMVRFILEPKAGYPSGQGLPQVYSAEAGILSVLPWAKDILRRWKWTFYVWSGVCVFIFEMMVVLCCCHQVLLPSKLLQGITQGFEEPEAIVKEPVVKRAGKPGRRVNFSDELPTARAIREPVDKMKERELLLGSSTESSTITTTGPRLRRLPTPAAGNISEASSSWSVPPPLETLDYVGGKVEAVEVSVKSLGEKVVDDATQGVGIALHKVKEALDPKTFKSD